MTNSDYGHFGHDPDCLSCGPCETCYRKHKRRIPVISGTGLCTECGGDGSALTVGCCERTDEDYALRRGCRTCRVARAVKANLTAIPQQFGKPPRRD